MDFLKTLGISERNNGISTGRIWRGNTSDQPLSVLSPVDRRVIGSVLQADMNTYQSVIQTATQATPLWQLTPAPKRGEIVRQIGLKLRFYKKDLGSLVSYEMGKSLQEGLGEVQEAIDICDYSVGLSRKLHGYTMHSERPNHRLYEQYHPLGVIGIITAFNFPVAVWAWNAMIAAVCGNVSVWKPSSKVPLSAIATQKIVAEVLKENDLPEGLFSLIIGRGATIGDALLRDKQIPLISFTGSVPTGRHTSKIVAERLGKTILELSGNNAIIMTEHADLKAALPAIVFGAVGTTGQRCTTTRRLIVHDSIFEKVQHSLIEAYKGLRIGNPLDEDNHVGPLIDTKAVDVFLKALTKCRQQGGTILIGGEILSGKQFASDCYVSPALVLAENSMPIVQQETFGPILYLIKYAGPVVNAINLQNDVRQGL